MTRSFTGTFFLYLFLFSFNNVIHTQPNLQNLLNSLQKADTSDQKEVFDKILFSLTDIDTNIARVQTEKLLNLTVRLKNPFYYNHALFFYHRFGSYAQKKKILFHVYQLALEQEDYDLMAQSKVSLSEVYQYEGKYDSSMVSILKAEELFDKINNIAEQVSVLHKIGDLFYNASLYDKAENYYKEVQRLKGEPKAWRDWRKFVITNNLGLIEKKRKKYDDAIQYFKNALNTMLSERGYVLNYMDTMRMVYSCTQLANVYLDKKGYNNADKYYMKGYALQLKHNWPEWCSNLFLIRGKILYHHSQLDSSLFYLNRAVELNKAVNNLPLYKDAYQYMTEIYIKQNKLNSAWYALNKHKLYSDSLEKKGRVYAGLQLVADNLSDRAKSQIQSYELKFNLLIGIVLVIALSLVLVLYINIKLRNTYRHLVKKNIDFVQTEDNSLKLILKLMSKTEQNETNNESFNKKNNNGILQEAIESSVKEKIYPAKTKNFIVRLEEIMIKQQLYLDPDISLENLSHLLNTNRTYLSKVINEVYGMNFTSYINEYRIKKAILTISQHQSLDMYTLEGIAKSIGFTNRMTFITAFKKYTGVTPSFFVKNLSN